MVGDEHSLKILVEQPRLHRSLNMIDPAKGEIAFIIGWGACR